MQHVLITFGLKSCNHGLGGAPNGTINCEATMTYSSPTCTATNAITQNYLNTGYFGGSPFGTTGVSSSVMQQIESLLSSLMGGGMGNGGYGSMFPGMFPGISNGNSPYSQYPGYQQAGQYSGYPQMGQYPGYPQTGQPGGYGTGSTNPGDWPEVKLTTKNGKPLDLTEGPGGTLYHKHGNTLESVGTMNSDGSITLNSSAKNEIFQLGFGSSNGFFPFGRLGGTKDSSGNVTFSPSEVTINRGDVSLNGPSTGGFVTTLPPIVQPLQSQPAQLPSTQII